MPINTKSPNSFFFTDSSFNQNAGDLSFKNIDENEFQITTTFQGNLKAYAVTDGTLFFAKHADSSDKINIILKPTASTDVGFKIKYFVYRGIKKSDYFKFLSGHFFLNDTSPLSFLTKVWQAYSSFNGSSADFTADKIGYNESLGTTLELIKQFYKKYSYQLLKVSAGDQIGSFVDGAGGFEIVLDEGDFSLEKSDTGLFFDTKFATAKYCKLKSDGIHTSDPNIFGGKINGDLGANIFRENIYNFLDPAAFFGTHIVNGNTGNISVYNANDSQKKDYNTPDSIYTNVIAKFLNKNKVYFYIKEKRNRSYDFYEKNASPIILRYYNPQGINVIVENFNEDKWPIKIIGELTSQFSLTLNLLAPKNNCIYINAGPNTQTFYGDAELFFESDTGNIKRGMVFKLNKQCSTLNYISCSFSDNIIDNFGSVTNNNIFEEADFSPQNKIGWVTQINSILSEDKNFISYYNTKIISDNTLQLRTYLLEPLMNNLEADLYVEEIKPKLFISGYSEIDLKKDSKKFCQNVLGISEAIIWRGEFKDGSAIIKSLALRKDENIYNTNRYLIGIAQSEVDILKARIPTGVLSTNHFFKLIPTNSNSLIFAKYSLQLEYDDKDGIRTSTTGTPEIFLYTIDGLFFFTKKYSDTFNFYKEFAKIAAEFRPGEDWMKYFNFPLQEANKTTYNVPEVFYGFDWLNKGDYRINYPSDYRIYESGNGFYDGLGDNSSTESNNTGATADNTKYFKAKKIYRSIPMSWKMLDGLFRDGVNQPTNFEPDASFDKDYAPSWLHIPPNLLGDAHPLSLKIRVRTKNKTKATQLKLYFNKKLFKVNKLGTLTNPTVNISDKSDVKVIIGDSASDADVGMIYFNSVDIPDVNKVKWIDFGITNILTINQQNIISIYDIDDNLVGKMYITPNSNELKKKAIVVIVKHKNVSGTDLTGVYDNHELELTKIFARQTSIDLDINVQTQVLDLTNDNDFQKFVDTVNGINFDITKTIGDDNYKAHEYLLTKIADKSSTKIFVVKRFSSTSSGGVMAFTVERDNCVIMYSDFLDVTKIDDIGYYTAMAHEYLHAQGLAHTFSGLSSDRNAFLTFVMASTNNVMDYSNAEINYSGLPPNHKTLILSTKFVQGSFFWQWAIARRFAKRH